MKRLVLLGLVFLSLAIPGLGSETKTLLEIGDLRSSYRVGDSVVINLVSRSEAVLSYGVGVEQRTETGWREIVPNIEEVTYSPTNKYRRLAPHGTKHLVWNTKVSVPGIPVSRGVYRFFVAFQNLKGGFTRSYSGSFSLRRRD